MDGDNLLGKEKDGEINQIDLQQLVEAGGGGFITKCHSRISAYIGWIATTVFKSTKFMDWMPTGQQMAAVVKAGWYHNDGSPCECMYCGGKSFDDVRSSIFDSHEYDIKCDNCNKIIGYYSYGAYNFGIL